MIRYRILELIEKLLSINELVNLEIDFKSFNFFPVIEVLLYWDSSISKSTSGTILSILWFSKSQSSLLATTTPTSRGGTSLTSRTFHRTYSAISSPTFAIASTSSCTLSRWWTTETVVRSTSSAKCWSTRWKRGATSTTSWRSLNCGRSSWKMTWKNFKAEAIKSTTCQKTKMSAPVSRKGTEASTSPEAPPFRQRNPPEEPSKPLTRFSSRSRTVRNGLLLSSQLLRPSGSQIARISWSISTLLASWRKASFDWSERLTAQWW